MQNENFKELYTLKMIQNNKCSKQNNPSTPINRETLKISVSNDVDDCCCCMPQLDATSFENGYSAPEELVCSAVGEERVRNSCATCISHTISLGLGNSVS
jgi:hypothetical protein